MFKNTKGFSLVELLVVMAIMVTLGGVGYQAMSGQQVTARDTARTTSLSNLQEALNAYYSKNNFFPQPALRYEDEQEENLGYRNVWGFIPADGDNVEALASCKLSWDSENNSIDTTADIEDFACGGVIMDRSTEVVVGWKGTLTEFAGKNALAIPSDEMDSDYDYINPLTHRDYIVAPFDSTYYDEVPMDPTFANVDFFQSTGIGNYIYSAYRKGIDYENEKNLNVGASQYQIATTLENSEEPTDATAYVVGNYVRRSKSYKTKVDGEYLETYLPYSLIGSANKVVMNEQQIDEAPSFDICPEEDKYSDDVDAPCNTEDLDGTDITSGDMGIPYPVIF